MILYFFNVSGGSIFSSENISANIHDPCPAYDDSDIIHTTDTETCREYILSEDYRDFIGNHVRTSFFDSIMQTGHCEQDAGFGYKCFYLPASSVDPVTLPKFSYNSIPKCYAPVSMETLNQTGILPVQNYPTLQLKGSGVLIGFLDSGIDYSNTIFRNLDGSTRIAAIWDQTVQSGTPPQAFSYGSEFTREQINEALLSENPLEIVPSTDDTGHGTYAASLAAGGADVGEQFLGAAPEASIAVVKLKQAKQYLRNYYYIPDNTVCYQETDIMLGLKFLNDLADSLEMPLVVCITCGTTMGGHIGTLPLSFLIDGYSTIANHITVIGTGNEADKRTNGITTSTLSRTRGIQKQWRSESGRMYRASRWSCGPKCQTFSPYLSFLHPGKTPRASRSA